MLTDICSTTTVATHTLDATSVVEDPQRHNEKRKDDEIQILCELVGGFNLTIEESIQDLKDKHLKPYCIVRFQGKIIHYSNSATEPGRDPIWTVSNGSLFILNASPAALLRNKLEISIWSRRSSKSMRGKLLLEKDTFSLGKASLDGKTLLKHCDEQRIELPLMDQKENKSLSDSNLALRFRLATKSDIRLLDLLKEQGISPPRLSDASFRRTESTAGRNPVKDLLLSEGSKLPIAPVITEQDESKLAGTYFAGTLSSAFRSSTTYDHKTGVHKKLVKPFPDPDRPQETKFMAPFDISKETMKPSKCWVEAGSGRIGTLHLEILSCHDLPNVDVGEAVGNLTDCFVCAVFEDVMVQTPVIDDELSPHWLPWTQRAFRIGIAHPASTLYLGALDYDLGPAAHEPLGRVAVNLSNLQSNTLYTLTFNLYPNSDLDERRANGSITIRLRIEYPDEKATVMAALQPRPTFHVNSQKRKTFKAIRYTCFGEFDVEEQFNVAIIKSYIFELLEYWRSLKFYVGQAIPSLVFWRGQVTIFNVHLPVHSAVLFLSCAVLIEKPWLIVPFYLLFVAWFLLATMAWRRKTPSPWTTCHSFLHYIELILLGKASDTREKIRQSENWERTQEFEQVMSDWRQKYDDEINERAAMDEKLLNIGNENISTDVAAGQIIPVELLNRLGRYQGIVGRLCARCRKIKSIIIWEESLTSFWITTICLAAGFIGLLLPWRFILYHGGRIVVWGFMGPQMRLVDEFLRSSSDADKEKSDMFFQKQRRLARIRREEAVKLKDMKCLAFGDYVTLIPSFNLPKHYDRALHTSSAIYVPPEEKQKDLPATSRLPGQNLHGIMIPHTEVGLALLEKESKEVHAQLSVIEEQLARLETIETHMSSRHIKTDYDDELPDDLGYEISIDEHGEERDCDESSHMLGHFKGSLSFSQIGLQASEEQGQITPVTPQSSDRVENTTRRIMQQSIPEEEKKSAESWDMDDSDNNSVSTVDEDDEHEETPFLTPLQTHATNANCGSDNVDTEMSFITPEQGPVEDTTPTSPLQFLELKLNQFSQSFTNEASQPMTSTKDRRSIFGPRRKETESGIQSPSIQKAWSASETRNDKVWIKASPTDSVIDRKASRRRDSVKLEEGLEIVAMGRLRTIGDEDGEEDEVRSESMDAGNDCSSQEGSGGLSDPFESSRHVQVATYRP